jgi:transposase
VKKDSTAKTSARRAQVARAGKLTIGIDLGDRVSRYCILNEEGEVLYEGSVATTKSGINQVFGAMPRRRIAMETGAHSPWVSRQLGEFGHEVIVANARNVRLICESTRKDDRLDAKTLARLARIDPGLLCPVRHHSAVGQAQLSVIRARAVLVSARTALVNAARGLAKPHGERLRRSGTQQFGRAMGAELSAELRTALDPLLTAVEGLSEQIQVYDRHIEQIAKEQHPEVRALKQVDGVGTLIALGYALTIEDPHRFRRSRDVGCYFGLRPGRRNSGDSQPQLHISKEGDRYLRTLMVQGAHHILGPFGKDCDLRRWGLKLAGRGGKNAKKRAIIAVARKLAVLLHRLWVGGEVYEPLRNSQRPGAGKAA